MSSDTGGITADGVQVPGGNAPPADGRRARRERNQRAAIDAMFELLREGKVAPPVEEVAARAGLSPASVFRYFAGRDELQRLALEHFVERFMPRFRIEGAGGGARADRIERLVSARLAFYDEVGVLLARGRARAHDDDLFVAARERMRTARAEQIREQFAPELDGVAPARASDLIAGVDSLISAEAWDLLREYHGWSRGRIATVWVRNVAAVVEAWLADDRPASESASESSSKSVSAQRRRGGGS